MFPAKLAFVTALSLYIFFNLVVAAKEVTRNANPSPTDNCANCPSCQCPPSVPTPGYPLYGPPPPAPPPSSSPGYPYGRVPPPPPPRGQGKCPPTQPGQCCQQYPQNPQYLSPPGGYVPYPDDNHAANSSPFSIFLSVMMVMLFYSTVLFF
ncbi:splicing factor 3B subunit 4-like [Pyrus x bretschneideri]|uniref:splicing factor 3B subunit 4-like n=1 Tax=Pyrus x bretschneideri TaxID=225117 RepID=UPI00202F4474|nr:splicing factor 3B subunit 4-like [Pyrus x bretschneideri]